MTALKYKKYFGLQHPWRTSHAHLRKKKKRLHSTKNHPMWFYSSDMSLTQQPPRPRGRTQEVTHFTLILVLLLVWRITNVWNPSPPGSCVLVAVMWDSCWNNKMPVDRSVGVQLSLLFPLLPWLAQGTSRLHSFTHLERRSSLWIFCHWHTLFLPGFVGSSSMNGQGSDDVPPSHVLGSPAQSS